jgi:hypothetical protein
MPRWGKAQKDENPLPAHRGGIFTRVTNALGSALQSKPPELAMVPETSPRQEEQPICY